jgi:hypothetical protein
MMPETVVLKTPRVILFIHDFEGRKPVFFKSEGTAADAGFVY